MASKNTPRRVVLNLIRVTPGQAVAIQRLIEIGALFGFKENAVRVAVARLTADGLLESDERGSYRLGPATSALTAHVEDWRRGEARMRPWDGGWLAVSLPQKPHRPTRRASLRALSRLGIAEGFGGLWVRPDNLRAPLPASVERLHALGLEEAAEVFRIEALSPRMSTRLENELWPLSSLERGYAETLASLRRSMERVEQMPREQALVESFLLGGEAIRVLATDPLLPEPILCGRTRAQLTETMLRYDELGHALWRRFASGDAPRLSVIEGGRSAG